MTAILITVALLLALGIGFLGGWESTQNDLRKREEEIEYLNVLLKKMDDERQNYISAAEIEKRNLYCETARLRERLLIEINGDIFVDEEEEK